MNIATKGDLISFERNKVQFTGTVEKLYNNSVLVHIHNTTIGKERYESTIVSHKNYSILK